MKDPLERHLAFLEWPAVCSLLGASAESTAGKRAARALRPSFDREQVEARLSRTDEAVRLLRAEAAPSLEQTADLARTFHAAAQQERGLGSRELRSVATTLQVASHAAEVYAQQAPGLAGLLARPAGEREHDDALAEELLAVIGPYGTLLDDASELLHQLREAIRQADQALVLSLNQLLLDSSVMLAVREHRAARYQGGPPCLKVKPEELRRVAGPILGEEPSCLFVAPDALRAEYNRLRDLQRDELREVQRIVRAFNERVEPHAARFADLADGLIACDLHQAFARYALERDLSAPELSEDLRLELRDARHPLLIAQGSCVPIALTLDPDRRLVVITGPNGGGKTVALKTVGLAAALAQVGCFVPAAQARLPVFERFLTVAESKSSVSDGVSTFQAHARDLAACAAATEAGSLILLDEIGVGTDPGEAAALAQAFLEHTLDAGSLVLATTHLPPLKVFAREAEGAANAKVELDADGTPTFALSLGAAAGSHALQVARQAGLPAAICDRAEQLHGGHK